MAMNAYLIGVHTLDSASIRPIFSASRAIRDLSKPRSEPLEAIAAILHDFRHRILHRALFDVFIER